MWRTAFVVVVVPAPEEPVIAIIGCLTDIIILRVSTYALMNELHASGRLTCKLLVGYATDPALVFLNQNLVWPGYEQQARI